MNDQDLLERIILNPAIMMGKPVIRGTRLSVEFILNLLAHGESVSDIISEYADLFPEDIEACSLFTKKSLENISCMPCLFGACVQYAA